MNPVAVVDDDESVRRAISRLLSAAGIEARAFASSKQFLETCDLALAACLVIDLYTRTGSALQLIHECRNLNPRLPIIALSALPDVKSKAIAAGASVFFTKPFDPVEFLATIHGLLV